MINRGRSLWLLNFFSMDCFILKKGFVHFIWNRTNLPLRVFMTVDSPKTSIPNKTKYKFSQYSLHFQKLPLLFFSSVWANL